MSKDIPVNAFWPKWKKYIYPVNIDFNSRWQFETDLLNGLQQQDKINTVWFQHLFGEKIAYILLSLGYVANKEQLFMAHKKEKQVILSKIEKLLEKTYESGRPLLEFDRVHQNITVKEYNKKLKEEHKKHSNKDYLAGCVLSYIIEFWGNLLKQIDQTDDFHRAYALNDIYESLNALDTINCYYYKYQSLNTLTKAATATSDHRKQVRQTMIQILQKHKIGRPDKRDNPIETLVKRAKELYLQETGKEYPNSNRTLENLIYEMP